MLYIETERISLHLEEQRTVRFNIEVRLSFDSVSDEKPICSICFFIERAVRND
jgi:hypothetical protein